MIQGTGSHVGKSVIVAGLCRLFNRRGYRVCPFKTQNMALNSFVTEDGSEMGRAQVVQAEAAGLKPDVRMNPILIKPVSDCNAQVIFMGKVVSDMSAKRYDGGKRKYLDKITDIFMQLKEENDIVIIEGAGSPAEINLLENDIVNMKTAEFSQSPVIIVGDIDKGGVFASFYGTTKILPDNYQDYIKGYLINKFRGDKDLLKPGIKWLEEKMDRPVLGVIPYFREIMIEEEDSVNLEKQKDRFIKRSAAKDSPLLKIAVIYLQHISNFTDFNSLDIDSRVEVNYVKDAEGIRSYNPDLVIIPGSKSTIKDLRYLRDSGMEKEIVSSFDDGASIMGICGGYQMLGKRLVDNFLVESEVKSERGFGFLDISTEFSKSKKTVQATFKMTEGASAVMDIGSDFLMKGYEIHMGVTDIPISYTKLFKISGEETDGVIIQDPKRKNIIMGTYIHGIFDNKAFRDSVIKKLCDLKYGEGKVLAEDDSGVKEYFDFKQGQYDKLAELIENNTDIDLLHKIIENGI